MIHINDILLHFGERTLFNHISTAIDQSDRIGLVGRNGSGKSTLLKAINNPSLLDEGTITIAKNKTIAYMPQEMVLLSDKTILEETFSAFDRAVELQEQIKLLEQTVQQDHQNLKAIDQLVAAHEELSLLDADQALSQTKQILHGLGFTDAQFNHPVKSLSVGWKMRIVLAQLLLKKADFYLFDEPTNHLDIVAKDWFIDFLKNAPFGFLLVCHERYLMEQLCSSIFELEIGNGKRYNMRYSAFEIQKEHDLELLKQRHQQQQKDITQKQRTIERFRASASKAKMAKSMERALDKIERIELPPSPKNIHFSFKEPERPGRIVLEAHNVGHQFGEKKLFRQLNAQIERFERVALIAPNGVGKTTFFNLLVNRIPLQEGSISFGHNVTPTIFHQDQHAVFDLNDSVINNVFKKVAHRTEAQIRSMLGCFLFTKDDVNKSFKVLSGGEKNRVAMATVLLQDANFLLLDEPTNHLDIYAKDILLNALKSYKGTIFFVSHDHDFINGLATRIIELTPQGAFSYQGNYDAFKQQQEALKKPSDCTKNSIQTKDASHSSHQSPHKQTQNLEKKIERLEQKIATQEAAFAALEWGTHDYELATKKLDSLKQELNNAMNEWEKLH